MHIERINNEIVIRISENIEPELLQEFFDYIKAKSTLLKSQATEEDVEKISNQINKSWWAENNSRVLEPVFGNTENKKKFIK
jgi:hypothetical protein